MIPACDIVVVVVTEVSKLNENGASVNGATVGSGVGCPGLYNNEAINGVYVAVDVVNADAPLVVAAAAWI